jgi:hypothetical protein
MYGLDGFLSVDADTAEREGLQQFARDLHAESPVGFALVHTLAAIVRLIRWVASWAGRTRRPVPAPSGDPVHVQTSQPVEAE